jgi:hypothetical protein
MCPTSQSEFATSGGIGSTVDDANPIIGSIVADEHGRSFGEVSVHPAMGLDFHLSFAHPCPKEEFERLLEERFP